MKIHGVTRKKNQPPQGRTWKESKKSPIIKEIWQEAAIITYKREDYCHEDTAKAIFSKMTLKKWLDDYVKDTDLQHFMLLKLSISPVDEARKKFRQLWSRGIFDDNFYFQELDNLKLIDE